MTNRERLLHQVAMLDDAPPEVHVKIEPRPTFDEVLAGLDRDRPVMIRRGRARGALVGLAAAVIALAVMVPVMLLTRGGDDAPPATDPSTTSEIVTTTEAVTTTVAPTTTEAPTTTIAAAATTLPPTTTTEPAPTTTTIPPTPAILEMTWNQVPTQEAFGLNDGIWKVIEGGPGFIAVGNALDLSQQERCAEQGECEGFVDAAVWVSSDGLAWEKVGDPAELTGVPTQFGTEMNQVMMDVVAGPGGYVAVGWVDRATGDTDPPIWFSPDGLSWQRIRGETEGFAEIELGAVVSDEAGYLAIGVASWLPGSSHPPSSYGAWRSPDGRTWTRVDDGETEIWGTVDGWSIRLAQGADRYVVTTVSNGPGDFRGSGSSVAQTSIDGVRWDVSPIAGGGGIVDVGTIGDRFVAAGLTEDGHGVWASDDGMTWEMLGEIHAPGRTLFLRAPVADGDRWVISALEATGRMPAGVGVVFASDDGGRTWHEVAAFDSSVEGPYDGTVDQRPPGFRDLIAVGDGFLAVGGTGNGSAPVWYGTWTQRSEE